MGTDRLYQIIVRCSTHARIPRQRIVARLDEDAGVDAAIRELRRIRNTSLMGEEFDRWDLYDYGNGWLNRRFLRSGDVYGPDQKISGADQHSGDTPPY